MLNFRYSSLIDASVEKVWQFHERPDILDLLTPPWQPVTIIRREGGLAVGAISEFRLSLAGIPVPWIATHIECEPYHLFVDQQTKGLMESWVHRHEFTPENGMTRLTDTISYEIPGGLASTGSPAICSSQMLGRPTGRRSTFSLSTARAVRTTAGG